MPNYPDYKIDKLFDFNDLFNRIKAFKNKVAFVNNGVSHTYQDFCVDVEKTMSMFSSSDEYVLLNIKDKYLFSVAYFATVLSGNIACLQPFSNEKLSCFEKFNFICELDDPTVEKAIETSNSLDAIFRENESISTVICSSGTTATPKAVALSQKNIIFDLVAGMEKYQFPDNGVYVNIIPYTHAFGVVCDLLGPLYSASTIYLTYDVVSFLVGIANFSPTALNITPGIVEVLIQRIEAVGNKSKVVGNRLKKILSGGAGTPATLCEKMAAYEINVCGCYGLSECAPCVSVNRDDYNKFGSAGIPLNCNTLSIEPSGEIKINGSNVMIGYLDNRGNIIEELHGEYKTGDIGIIDEDGFLFVQGRVDDLIVFSNGNKLMPQIIEAELNALSGIKESIVYMFENKLTATIVVEENNSKDIKTFIQKSVFQGYKIAKVYITTDPLARNAMGKLNRRNYGR